MYQTFKDAYTVCKTILRNGFDAYIINAPLQYSLMEHAEVREIDIACQPDFETLLKFIPDCQRSDELGVIATWQDGDVLYRFYSTEVDHAMHPELAVTRITPHLLGRIPEEVRSHIQLANHARVKNEDSTDGFANFQEDDSIRLLGLPDETLRHNYLLAVRALRFAANTGTPLDPNTRAAIIRASSRVLDYVPFQDIMDEWRKVLPHNMGAFVTLLLDTQLLHGIMPEMAALDRLKLTHKDGTEESIFLHSVNCMNYYTEDEFHHDWLGTLAAFLHDVGKAFTAEYFNGKWTFYQHHQVGAQVARKILHRLHMPQEDIDLICHLVRNHMRFQFMLTDRGIRRFRALDDYPRLIELARANNKALDEPEAQFNHNMKYLERAETPEQMLEPLLNGREIMQHTGLPPGPMVGLIRDALLNAQIRGEVTDVPSALNFAQAYALQNMK